MAGRGRGMLTPAWMLNQAPPPQPQSPTGLQQQQPVYYQPPQQEEEYNPRRRPLNPDYHQEEPTQQRRRYNDDHHNVRPPRDSSSEERRKPYASSRATGSDRSTLRARRLYVGGTDGFREDELQDYFNLIIRQACGIDNSTLAVTVNERNFAFVEFSEIEIMHAILNLNSIPFKGKLLKFQKPKDFELNKPLGNLPFVDLNKITAQDYLKPLRDGSSSHNNKQQHNNNNNNGHLRIDNLPLEMDERGLTEILGNFGALKSSQIVRNSRGQSEGVGYCEFIEIRSAEEAMRKLNSSNQFKVTKATRPPQQQYQPPPPPPPQQQPMYYRGGGYAPPPPQSFIFPPPFNNNQSPILPPLYSNGGGGGGGLPPPYSNGGLPPPYVVPPPPPHHHTYNNNTYIPPNYNNNGIPPPYASTTSTTLPPPTKVLLLLNMVTREELENDQEYNEIFEDTKSEAEKYGKVEYLTIPKVGMAGEMRVFICFSQIPEAIAAFNSMNGRRFSNRTVEARFYDERSFLSHDLTQ